MNTKLNTIVAAAIAAASLAAIAQPAGATQYGAFPRTFAGSIPAENLFAAQPQASAKKCHEHGIAGGPPPYLFASDNVTANLYEYCEDMPPNLTTPRLTFTSSTGFAGWGLAVSPSLLGPGLLRERLAVGTYGGTVNVYNVQNTGLLNQHRTLHLAAVSGSVTGNALGICFDGTGGLYATNYPYAEIDYFNNAAVVAGALAPTARIFTTMGGSAPFYPTYLACDYDKLITKGKRPPGWENIVMVDGVDSAGNADVGQLGAGGAVATLPGQVLGPYGVPGHFPGGMTIDRRDDLVVSDWSAGTMLNFGPKEPWPQAVSVCKVESSGSTGAYLPIDFDDSQKEIWAGNSFTAPPSGSANAASVPFPWKQVCGPKGESGGPTSTLTNAFFVGIAVWPNTGV